MSSEMKDRRQSPDSTYLEPELVLRATTQLEQEIRLIEGWLAELEEASRDNSEALSARRSYGDMIQSRKDLLEKLNTTVRQQ